MSVFAMRKLAYGKVFVTASADKASANAKNAYKRNLRRLSSGLCIQSFPLTQDRGAVRRHSSVWKARPDWKMASFSDDTR
jgi:hypothetical protein